MGSFTFAPCFIEMAAFVKHAVNYLLVFFSLKIVIRDVKGVQPLTLFI